MVTMVSVLKKMFFAVAMLYCISGAASCSKNEFECEDGEQCIDQLYRCDGIRDCGDSSDESGCSRTRCPEGYHRCQRERGEGLKPSWQCLKGEYVCDETPQCSDGSDEKDCGNVTITKVNEFLCSDGQKGIPMRQRCDGNSECSDRSDETDCGPCPKGMLSCDSGQCVRGVLFCNGQRDCQDGSDEKDCGYEESEIFFLNEGPNIYIKKRTKAGLEFTHLLPISDRMKRTGLHNGLKITGLSYDVRNQILFISDAGSRPAIIAVNVTSLDWRYLVTESITYPMDIAFDWSSNNLYWVDSGSGTAEVISVDTLKRKVILRDLSNPVALALSPQSGVMVIATTNTRTHVTTYEMDGRSKMYRMLIDGSPASLAVDLSKNIVYWTDPAEGTISYVSYLEARLYPELNVPKILRKKTGVMAVTVTEREYYFTSGGPLTSEKAHRGKFPGYEKDEGWKSITYGVKHSGRSGCLIDNGGCKYLCLTSKNGISCACPSEKTLAEDGKSCLG